MGKLRDEFEKLRSDLVERKSKQYAGWINPALYPDSGYETAKWESNTGTVDRDFQSFGSQLISYAASKLMQELFPIGKSFFKLELSDDMYQKAAQILGLRDPSKVDGDLVKFSNEVCELIHIQGNYARISWGIQVLLTTGNILFFYRNDGKFVAYTTRNYAIKRDGAGNPLRLILRERAALRMLPKVVQAGYPGKSSDEDEMVDYYTGVRWGAPGENVQVWQEAGEWSSEIIEYHPALCPFLPLVANLIPGESYGRGRVEDNAGDFAKYSELSKALALYEAQMCRVVNGVKPGAVVDIDELENAETGDYVQADPDSVQAMEMGDGLKVQRLQAVLAELEARLNQAFGRSINTRDAERVTAQEIIQNAQEADIAHAGLYSLLSHTLHYPMALLLLQALHPDAISLITTGKLDVRVMTGVSALGQSAEVQAMLRAAQSAGLINQVFAGMSQKFSPERIADICLLSEGVDPTKIERTEEELQALQQASAPLNPADPQNITNAIQGTVQNG